MNFTVQPIGYALGETLVRPEIDLVQVLTPDQLSRTGFKELHWSAKSVVELAMGCFDGEVLDDLADEVDTLIFVSSSHDGTTPGPGRTLAAQLGLRRSLLVFDLNDACTGFISGLQLAVSLLESGHRNVLLVTSDVYSQFGGVRDSALGALFSDSSAAVLVAKEPKASRTSFLPAYQVRAAHFKQSLQLESAAALRTRLSGDNGVVPTDSLLRLQMNGSQVFSFVLSNLPDHVDFFRSHAGQEFGEMTWLVHQGSKKVVDAVQLAIGSDQSLFCSEKLGNTVGSSIPIQLISSVRKANDSKSLGLLAFGVGLSFASCLLELSDVERSSSA